MKVHGFYCILLCVLVGNSKNTANGKTVFRNKFGGSNRQYGFPAKRIASNPIQYSGDISSNDFEDTLLETANNVPAQQQSAPSSHNIQNLQNKRSPGQNTLNLKAETVKKRNLFSERKEDEPYGVVFSHGKAIGVLKPLSHSYELASFEDESAPLEQSKKAYKREVSRAEFGDSLSEQRALYANGRYPEILANFKIGNRLQMMRSGQDHKRENSFTRKIVAPLKSNDYGNRFQKRSADLSKNSQASVGLRENKASENIDQIEDNIRGIISDLGLTEQEATKEKRSVDDDLSSDSEGVANEDENLENGSNKISLRKETHEALSRKKKEDVAEQKTSSTMSSKVTDAASSTSASTVTEKSKVTKREVDSEDAKPSSSDSAREKRENPDIVRGLETSGELTVSGNKSPLASSSNEHEVGIRSTLETKSSTDDSVKQKRDNQQLEYEKEIEENLQQKINAIKEQVKREYNALKYGVVDEQRSKREAPSVRQNNLIDAEIDSVKPDFNTEQALAPHIRSKRDQSTNIVIGKQVIVENAEDINKKTKRIKDSRMKRDGDIMRRNGNVIKYDIPIKTNENTIKTNENRIKKNSHIQKREISEISRSGDDSCPRTISTSDNTPNKFGAAKSADLKQQRNLLEEINSQANAAIQNSNLIFERVKDNIALNNVAKETDNKAEECPGRTKVNNEDHGPQGNSMSADKNAKSCPKVKRGQKQISERNVLKKDGADFNEEMKYNLLNNFKEDASLEKKEENGNRLKEDSSNLKEDMAGLKEDAQKSLRDEQSNDLSSNLKEDSFNNLKEDTSSNLKEDTSSNLRDDTSSNLKEDTLTNLKEDTSSNLKEDTAHNLKEDMPSNLEDSHLNEDNSNLNEDMSNSNLKELSSNLKDDSGSNLREDADNAVSSRRRRRSNSQRSYPISRRNVNHHKSAIFTRRKRSSAVNPDGNVAYLPFRSEEDEVDEEGDEFDDDGFDDRTASLVRNRRQQAYYSPSASKNEEYDSLTDDDYDTSDNAVNDYYPKGLRLVKRDSQARNYVDNLNSDSDEASNYENNYENSVYSDDNAYRRRKRQSYEDDAAFRDSGTSGEQRSVSGRVKYPLRRTFRRKRVGKDSSNAKKYEGSELSDSDIFGALPQSYEGELSRFKRVKRSSTNNKVKPAT